MKKIQFALLLLFVTAVVAQTKSPKEFLGYELGERFTHHHQVVDYLKHVAENNSSVRIEKYGETYEKRPLYLTYITAPKNIEKLEELRENHLKAAGVLEGTPSTDIPVVWMSYNVHGNEASCTEAAIKTLYALVDPNNKETKKWLENLIVIIDPNLNPDGRDRYVNWYGQFGNSPINSDRDSKEHREPWLGGRPNHYMFDLNRDWAWLTQIESQQRIKQYNKWMPNIHVDFHEQYVDNPYYFPPAAEPFHEVISNFQREFQTAIGKNHAKYFDKNGWLYFTKESFDLLYPSYGDTYPTFNGAIGMTYEQAGHGMGGLSVTTSEGGELTLKDRVLHHHTTGLSTIETASLNAEKLKKEFAAYFRKAKTNPKGKYKSYVISGKNHADKISSLRALLDKHEIKYGQSTSSASVKGFDYETSKNKTIRLSNKDLVISMNQPKSNFVKVLFEPQAKLRDSATYDITAWSLPYARGLKAYALPTKVANAPYKIKTSVELAKEHKAYAYVYKWNSVKDANFLGYLLEKGIKVRYAGHPFTVEGQDFKAGSLIVTRAGNEKLGNTFDDVMTKASRKFNRKITAASTGFVEKGKDFGSATVKYIKKPKVAIVAGRGVSTLGFGEVWHFFEQQLKYPVTVLDVDYFNSVDLSKYNVLVLPNGWYGSAISEKRIKTWVQKGGRLIAIDGALRKFANKDGFGLKTYKDEATKTAAEKKREARNAKNALLAFDKRERESVSNLITGSIFKATMDATNPLGFGYNNYYHTLRLNNNHYAYLKNGQNVSVIKDKKDQVSGFAGAYALENTSQSLVFGVQPLGRGTVVYFADNPLFRSFWENGKLAFCNAVFMVGQ